MIAAAAVYDLPGRRGDLERLLATDEAPTVRDEALLVVGSMEAISAHHSDYVVVAPGSRNRVDSTVSVPDGGAFDALAAQGGAARALGFGTVALAEVRTRGTRTGPRQRRQSAGERSGKREEVTDVHSAL